MGSRKAWLYPAIPQLRIKTMRHLKLYLTAFCLALLVPFLTHAQTQKPMQLEDFKWKNRLLLLFSPDQNHADLSKQKDLIGKNTQGVAERDLLVLELAPNGKHAAHRQELLTLFGVEEQAYTLILVGKDGLEKYRSQKQVPMQEIFSIIDQMPMRRQEMRNQE